MGRFPDFVCPRCKGALDARDRAHRCRACDAVYPVVAGIPDFRVFPGPWLDLEGDRDKARRLDGMVDGAGLEEALRSYWSITPSTPREEAERFVEHCLRARSRSEEWLGRLAEDGVRGGWSGARTAAARGGDAGPRRGPCAGDAEGDGGAPGRLPWLDLGCGTADLTAAAAAAGRPTVGVDIALRWLVVARRRPGAVAEGARLVCACAEALPFPDGSFGRGLSLGLLAHAEDPGRVLEEARRVLAPGGRVALRTVNRYTLLPEPHVGVWGVGLVPRRWADAYVRWRTGRGYRHHRPLSPRELRRAMTSAGFHDVSVEAAPTLDAEARGLSDAGRGLVPLYETARRTPGVRHAARWAAPLLEARGRRP
jgi:ubiquinone/menaquinone biosynthesis C-methylase UbiE